MEHIIRTDNLYKEYSNKKGESVKALNGIDLLVNKGEYISIQGVSGSGKSTLLHILGGLDRATSGSVEVIGEDFVNIGDRKLSAIRNKDIGFVLQDFGLIPYKTVYENVMIPLFFRRDKVKSYSDLICKSLDNVGVLNLKKKKINELSGGEKQRVAIARALVNDPELILADEPTGALDSKTKTDIVELFLKLNKEGKTIIVVTHDPDVADSASRKLFIKDGKLSQTI